MTIRTPAEVFASHLHFATIGDFEADLQENYAEDVVVIYSAGAFKGLEAVRAAALQLNDELPNAHFQYTRQIVAGEYAYLEWTATSDRYHVDYGTDTFVIRDDKIQMQSFYYVLE